jgi:hypothetical protein
VPIDNATREAQVALHVLAIKALHHRVTLDKFKIGWHLNEVKKLKAEVPHGQFMLWVRRNFTFSVKTAERWMNRARAFEDKFDTVSNLPINSRAFDVLSRRDVPAEAIDKAIKIAESGQKINEHWAKSIVFEAKREERVKAGEADPFTGLSPENIARVTQSLGFFRDESDLRRRKSDPIPPSDILTWLSLFISRIKKLSDRECYRRRAHNGIPYDCPVRSRHRSAPFIVTSCCCMRLRHRSRVDPIAMHRCGEG